jgi:hypothetical protein
MQFHVVGHSRARQRLELTYIPQSLSYSRLHKYTESLFLPKFVFGKVWPDDIDGNMVLP